MGVVIMNGSAPRAADDVCTALEAGMAATSSECWATSGPFLFVLVLVLAALLLRRTSSSDGGRSPYSSSVTASTRMAKDAAAEPPTPPPPSAGAHLRPPGCHELQRHDRPHWSLPFSDPTFRELCTAKLVVGARGRCYQLKQRGVKCLPSFLVIGFTKSGTSVFFQYVAQHTLVRTARIKEPTFFGSDMEYLNSSDQGNSWKAPPAKTLRWYMNLFPACSSCELGEATPSYAWRDFASIAAAQARLLLGGETKLLMLVREPIERAASHYLYFHDKRRAFRMNNLSLALAFALDEFERCAAQLNGWRHQCTYRAGRRQAEITYAAIRRTRPELWRLKNKASYELVQAGLYSEHLLTWRAQFSATNILCIDMALLLTTPLRAMRRFERHLGLPHMGGYETSLEHALASPRVEQRNGPVPGASANAALSKRVDSQLRARLEAFFTPFNRKLKKATGVGWSYGIDSKEKLGQGRPNVAVQRPPRS